MPCLGRLCNQLMPLLDPIPGLLFDEQRHRYAYNGQWMTRSVTQVLQGELDPVTIKRFEQTKHIWAPRGSAVHKALEERLLDQGSIYSQEYAEWIDPLLDHPLWEGAEVLAVEYCVVDPKKSLAGSFDFLMRTARGTLVLGDLKTVGSANGVASRKPAEAQLGGYLHMLCLHHPEMLVERCLTVVAGPGETDIKVSQPQDCLDAWSDAWERHEAVLALKYDF